MYVESHPVTGKIEHYSFQDSLEFSKPIVPLILDALFFAPVSHSLFDLLKIPPLKGHIWLRNMQLGYSDHELVPHFKIRAY